MPDCIEIAASGRARCRACARPIAKGEERFAEALPNPVAEGETRHYFHLQCAAERRPQAFAALLSALQPPRPELEPLARAAALASEHRRLERLGVLERAKSARAACRHCREPIDKGSWRVAIQPFEDGRMVAWGYIHLSCAANYVGIKPSPERVLRYSALEPEERSEVEAVLEALPVPAPLPASVADPEPPADPAAR